MAERRRSAHAIDVQNNGGTLSAKNHVTRYLVIYIDRWTPHSSIHSQVHVCVVSVNVPPLILEQPPRIIPFVVGETIALKCIASGQPDPE